MLQYDLSKLSERYRVIRAELSDVNMLYQLYLSQRQYFEYFSLEPSKERLIEDMTMKPDGCREDQKLFLAYYQEDQPVALLDLIEGYPSEKECYIGLFMVDAALAGHGIGTGIVTELCDALGRTGYQAVRLAYGKHYAHGKHFWTKNGFSPVKEAVHPVYGELIVASRSL